MIREQATKYALVFAALAFGALPCLAQKQTPPAGGPPRPFNLPAHETYTLPNGMKVTLVPYGHIPKVTLDLALRTGNLNDPKGQTGLADLTSVMLKEGTKTQNAEGLAQKAAQMGGQVVTSVSDDETSIDIDVLGEFGPQATALLADVVQNPLLPESELQRHKDNMLRSLAVAKSQPQVIAQARFRKLMYGDHPYGEVLWTEDGVKSMTIADVKKFYAENYGAARAHLYVAGMFDSAAVKKAIADSFGGWAKGPAIWTDAPKPKTQRLLDVTDRPGAPQSTIRAGLPVANATSPDNIQLLVTNALLGGSFGSRITTNIREKMGCSYSPYSQISRRYHDAYWVEAADVTTECTGKSLTAIFGEIKRLQDEPPGAAELKGIETYLSGIFVIQNDTRNALIGQLRYTDLQGLGDEYLKTYVQKVNAVTPEQVQEMTKKYIKPGEMTIVVVGDKAKITEQLAPFEAGGGKK